MHLNTAKKLSFLDKILSTFDLQAIPRRKLISMQINVQNNRLMLIVFEVANSRWLVIHLIEK